MLWAIGIATFRSIATSGAHQSSTLVDFLRNVPLLASFNTSLLVKLAAALESADYDSGEYIIRHGETGNTFYIIESGEVRVTSRAGTTEKDLITLKRGDYFGEMVRFEA